MAIEVIEDEADATAHRITGDLGSGDPDRVADAVRELDMRWQRLQDVAIPAPAADVLDVLDPATSEDVAVAYVSALSIHDFDPPVDPRDRLRWTVEALLRHGGSRLATEVFLKLADPESFGSGPNDALTLVQELGVHSDRARDSVSWLVSFLLGHPDTRQPTLDVIASWTDRPMLDRVVKFVLPQLDPEERAQLG